MWIFSTWLCGWYGSNTATPGLTWPFLLTFGGIGQFICGMWCFPARDTLGTVFHSTWGALFVALGLNFVFNGALVTRYTAGEEVAMWFVTLAAITLVCTVGAVSKDLAFCLTAAFTTVGCVLVFGGWFAGDKINPLRSIKAGGYFLMVASLFALWRCASWLIEESFLGNYLPSLRSALFYKQAAVRVPIGEPGVRKGQ